MSTRRRDPEEGVDTRDGVADVSVVVPAFRASSIIGNALSSVQQQSIQPREVVIVDDGSGPDEVARIKEICDLLLTLPYSIIAVRQNQGPAAARNAGWEASASTFVAFLDADDVWHPRKLELQTAYMGDNPDVALTCHARVASKTNMTQGDPSFDGVALSRRSLLLRNRIVTSSVMVRRDLEQRFLEDLRYSEDYDLWLRLVSSNLRLQISKSRLAAVGTRAPRDSGLSDKLWQMQKGELGNYWRLMHAGGLSWLLVVPLWAWSLTKFVVRSALAAAPRVRSAPGCEGRR